MGSRTALSKTFVQCGMSRQGLFTLSGIGPDRVSFVSSSEKTHGWE